MPWRGDDYTVKFKTTTSDPEDLFLDGTGKQIPHKDAEQFTLDHAGHDIQHTILTDRWGLRYCTDCFCINFERLM